MKLFAFWRYDQYPYVLGGEIDMINDEGWVRVPSYGNAWFEPIKILPVKRGKELLAVLKGLENRRRQALEEFEDAWDEKLFAVFPEARHPHIQRHQAKKAPK